MRYLYILLLIFVSSARSQEISMAQNRNGRLKHTWRAWWIAHPSASPYDFGVYYFKKPFKLKQKPGRFWVHVSGDNRYRLFVNGKPVFQGPARSGPANWNYATIDISPYLAPGENMIAARVVNFGEHRAGGQMSVETGFILQGGSPEEKIVDTNASWLVARDISYAPVPITPETVPSYYRTLGFYAAGPGNRMYGKKRLWDWLQPDSDDAVWQPARQINRGTGRGYAYGSSRFLVPRKIPPLKEEFRPLTHIVRADGFDTGFLSPGEKNLVIPPFTQKSLLVDNGVLTVGYPEFIFSRGKGSTVKVTYAEALFNKKYQKGNRNKIRNKKIYGCFDEIFPGGGENRLYRPLWHRTFRYLQMDIKTGADSLIIVDFYQQKTGYPFNDRSNLSVTDSTWQKIWLTSWRTLALCAQEYFMSDAYFEQMQYIGDTRVQALASVYVSGDDRLMRNAIRQFHQSMVPCGLTQSRYPAVEVQIIPPYSLIWIDMIHDYFYIRNDPEFIRPFLPDMRSVLEWFEEKIDSTGMLGPLPWWNFADWAEEFPVGIPPGADTGHSAIISLQTAFTMQRAAKVFEYFQWKDKAAEYEQQASTLVKSVYRHCWDPSRRLLADTPAKKSFSQHANIWAVLTDMLPADRQCGLLKRILNSNKMIQCTLYFRFYMFEALKKAGLAHEYHAQLAPWKKMLSLGLTTFPETDKGSSRSDCHPWSASPCYHFLSLVCGVRPAAPGFRRVLIEPCLGDLTSISSRIAHPAGDISVNLAKQDSVLSGRVFLPFQVDGILKWADKTVKLKGGWQEIRVPAED